MRLSYHYLEQSHASLSVTRSVQPAKLSINRLQPFKSFDAVPWRLLILPASDLQSRWSSNRMHVIGCINTEDENVYAGLDGMNNDNCLFQ